MGLNIKNAEVERLATEVARMAGETKTEAIRKAPVKRRELRQAQGVGDRIDELMRWLCEEVWPNLPEDVRGKPTPKGVYDDLHV